MEDFILNFRELFEDIDISLINSDTIFHDLDAWDSIMALSVIGMIDDEYGVTLYNRIQSKK